MEKIYLTILLLIAVSLGISAQINYEVRLPSDFYVYNSYQVNKWKDPVTSAEIQGSPFLNDEFIQGSVYTKQKMKYVDLPLRYNIYNDQIEFKSDKGEIQAIAVPDVVEKIEYGNYILVYLPYAVGKKVEKGFFIVKENGDATLLEKPVVVFEAATEPAAYKEAEPPKFNRRSDEYYIRVGNEPAQILHSRKDVPKIFPDHSKEVERFIKENKVKPDDPETLSGLVKYYNSL